MELIIKFILALFVCGATTISIFSMFKIPIKSNDKQIAIFILVVGFINFYFKFILDSPFVFVYQIISFSILLVILRRYPILYAIIVTVTGFVSLSLIDAVASLVARSMNISVDQMINDLSTYTILHVVVALIYLLISYLLVKFNIGYSFVKRRFSGKDMKLSNANYIWGIMMILAMIVMTLLSQPKVIYSLNMYIVLLVGIMFISSICYAYVQNKISLDDRYKGVSGHK